MFGNQGKNKGSQSGKKEGMGKAPVRQQITGNIGPDGRKKIKIRYGLCKGSQEKCTLSQFFTGYGFTYAGSQYYMCKRIYKTVVLITV